jgi:hypothetical protein
VQALPADKGEASKDDAPKPAPVEKAATAAG